MSLLGQAVEQAGERHLVYRDADERGGAWLDRDDLRWNRCLALRRAATVRERKFLHSLTVVARRGLRRSLTVAARQGIPVERAIQRPIGSQRTNRVVVEWPRLLDGQDFQRDGQGEQI